MRFIQLSWEEINEIHKDLANRIKQDGIPDALVIILRGGAITGVHLSHLLGVRELYPLLIRRTEDDKINSKKIIPEVRFSDGLNLYNKNILIVDDIVGSGETMEIARHIVFKAKAKTVRSVVLVVNKSNFTKDNLYTCVNYVGKTVKSWTIFPWERINTV